MAQSSSRLNRHQTRESRRQIYFYIAVIVILLVVVLTFGTKIIEFIGNATYLIRGDSEETEENSITLIQSPDIDPLPEAVSTDVLEIKGSVLEEGGIVELFVNGQKEDIEKISGETSFTFSVKLEEGENKIKARYRVARRASEFSSERVVIYYQDKPKLEEISPSDGQTFKRGDERIEIRGKTDIDNTVTVNGFRAVVDQSGNFSYFLKLNSGENTVTIVAKNKAGSEEKREIKVNYSP